VGGERKKKGRKEGMGRHFLSRPCQTRTLPTYLSACFGIYLCAVRSPEVNFLSSLQPTNSQEDLKAALLSPLLQFWSLCFSLRLPFFLCVSQQWPGSLEESEGRKEGKKDCCFCVSMPAQRRHVMLCSLFLLGEYERA